MSTEYLSKDILEEVYIRSFSPFYTLEMILGTSRVYVHDRFVMGPTFTQKVYSLICAMITFSMYAYVAVTYFQQYRDYGLLYYAYMALLVFHYINFIANFVHVRFRNTEANAKFYIQMQQLDRLMRLDHGCINNILYLYNVYTVVSSMCIMALVFSSGLFLHYLLAVGFIGICYGILCCTLEWLHCASLLIYFFLRMRFINAILVNYLEGKIFIADAHKCRLPRKRLMRHLAALTNDFELSPVDEYVKALFSTFTDFQNLYRFQLLQFFSIFFVHTLCGFAIEILGAQKGLVNQYTWVEFLDMPTIAACYLLLAVVICVRCEVFQREVKQTKRLCITILSQQYNGNIREKAKRILQTVSACPPELSVYGMWTIRGTVVIHIINVITTLMIAMLQFMIL
ncbi:unnamed protein product [Leptosia nina]|uniref:Gustatory receptor n=1 Tax=Leptosia nina TaxID=320188 RepID=A0AAV1IWA1_9NEOP